MVRTDYFLWIPARDTKDNIYNECSRKLPQNGQKIHQIQGDFSDWWFDQKNHLYERKRDLKEVNNACSWLGTCVFPACNFLWGQVCSLTADEGSTLKLPRFIRFGNIQWRWRKAATFLSLLFTVLFRSLRRDDPQRCPVWTASLVWSGFWRLLRLHGYFFIPERRKPCELFPWIIVQPVLDISYELFRIFWNIGTFRNKASDKLVGTLIRTTFPCAVGVGVKHLCSWNVCQNRPFHSLEIKVFTAVVTGYRLECFPEFLCAEPSLELIKFTNKYTLDFYSLSYGLSLSLSSVRSLP